MPVFFLQITARILLGNMLFFCLLPGMSLASPLRLTQIPEGNGYLVLKTRHNGLEVKLDGKLVGRTPLHVIPLSPGIHKVIVRHPNSTNWLEDDWFTSVKILPGDTLHVPILFKKSYSINSQPYGASIFHDEQLIGQTPLFLKLYENASQQILLTKPGYRDTTLNIGNTRQQYFNIRMKKLAKKLDLKLGSAKSDLSNKSHFKKLLYIGAGLTIVSGGLTVYFKNKGDQKYDLYRKTGNPELREQYFNDAKKFDRYTAVSFGVFQINFIASFYLFLKKANR